ncbi:MAG: prepilin-type N-terminal cleavage/methylation domain-containing protein [Verrucomicrobia bacterium]|nr:prepilin-type N-terminal cleavage/methylation domain-containing protein [Verrucomicrobiota bacterium]
MNRLKSNVKSQRSELATCDLRPSLCDLRLATNRIGFTLIELIVVILVISILAVLAVEKIAAVLSSTRAQLAANEISLNLRYIRNMAMDQERTTRVIFSVVSNSYSVAIYDTNTSNFVEAVNPVTQQSPWLVDVNKRFPGVELAVSNIPGNTLYFSKTNGIPCYNTNSPLTTNGSITFDSGLTVTIVPDTGYIELK